MYHYTFGDSQIPLPKVTFSKQVTEETSKTGATTLTGTIRMETDTEPEAVRMYFARTQSRKRRDFRLDYIGCPDKNNPDEPWSWDKNPRWNTSTCECPETTRKQEEESHSNTNGVCLQPLMWTRYRENLIFKRQLKVDFKNITGEKYKFAWEGKVDLDEDDEYFRAAYR